MGKTATGEGVVAISPSDNVNITMKDGRYPRAVRFGTGGTCTVVCPDDSSASFTNIANGETLDIDVKRINSTGLTGCANIVGIY